MTTKQAYEVRNPSFPDLRLEQQVDHRINDWCAEGANGHPYYGRSKEQAEAIRDQYESQRLSPTMTLQQLADKLNSPGNDSGDLSDLPAFGGEVPADTLGVFSWDRDSLLVSDHNGRFVIVSRAGANESRWHTRSNGQPLDTEE